MVASYDLIVLRGVYFFFFTRPGGVNDFSCLRVSASLHKHLSNS